MVEDLFNAMDRDGDGNISTSELQMHDTDEDSKKLFGDALQFFKFIMKRPDPESLIQTWTAMVNKPQEPVEASNESEQAKTPEPSAVSGTPEPSAVSETPQETPQEMDVAPTEPEPEQPVEQPADVSDVGLNLDVKVNMQPTDTLEIEEKEHNRLHDFVLAIHLGNWEDDNNDNEVTIHTSIYINSLSSSLVYSKRVISYIIIELNIPVTT